MKKSTLFIYTVFSTTVLLVFACSKDDSSSPTTSTGGEDNSALIDPSNCWEDSSTHSQVLSVFLFVKSGPQKRSFYLESFVGQCAFTPASINRGIGTMSGFNFSYTLFGNTDTSVYRGIITDTLTGHKRMKLFTPNDTIVYVAQ